MSQSKNHQLRLSIDVRSIKDHQFTAQLYIKYGAIASLGIRPFKSSPTISVNNPKAEFNLSANCFASGYFEAGPGQVECKLSQVLRVELWHNDRLKKDVMLGVGQIDMKQVLSVPLRKKQDSFARVLDAYIPVDEVDQQGNPVKKIAAVRVLVYLQDLGPVQLLKQKGFDIRDLIEQNVDAMVEQPKLPSQTMANNKYEGSPDQRMELNELEYKVVWQLQTWKKAEQAKTRITLKQKQIQFWTNLSEQQRKGDIEKEKHFKNKQANLNLQETKLRAKMGQLMKREQKIIIYQQELQSKITQVSKEIFLKDEEIQRIKRKAKQQKTAMLKEKSVLELEISKFRAENARLKVQLEQAKKQDQRSPINLLKQQLNTKSLQNKELSKQLQKCNQVKQEYKLYYEKMKNQVITLRDKLKEKQESLREMKYEKDLLLNNYKNLEQKLNYQLNNNRNKQQYQYYQPPVYDVSYEEEDHFNGGQGNQYMSERDRLIKARQDLIDQGLYSPNDELIKEYDRNIASMS